MPALACLVRRGVAFEVFARDDLFSLDGFDAWLWLKLRLFLNPAECSSFLSYIYVLYVEVRIR